MTMKIGEKDKKDGVWETPDYFFQKLDSKYNFTLDACALHENAKCERYFTPEDDALVQDWHGRVFMNPPYGRVIPKWIEKAYNEVVNGNAEMVVCLLPARTDTDWFHKYCVKGRVIFVHGRIKFGGTASSGFIGSMVVIFHAGPKMYNTVDTMERDLE